MEEENKIIVEDITIDTVTEENVQENVNIGDTILADDVVEQDVQVIKQGSDLNSLEFYPKNGELTYSEDTATYTGEFTYTTTSEPDVPIKISGKISFNIASGNGINIDVDETNSKVKISLDSSIISSIETIGSEIDNITNSIETLNNDVQELGNEQNQLANDLTNEIANRQAGDEAIQFQLANYCLKVDAGHTIEMTIDPVTFILTLNLKNIDGTTLSTQNVDLPLETMIVNGRYNEETKMVILTLQNGQEISFSVADLISGLASQEDLDNVINNTTQIAGKIDAPYGEDDETRYTTLRFGGADTNSKNWSIVIGANTKGGQLAVGLGNSVNASANGDVAIGSEAGRSEVYPSGGTNNGVSIGANAKIQGSGTIQLGTGTNTEAGSFQVKNYKLLDANGIIPNERLSAELLSTIETSKNELDTNVVKLEAQTLTEEQKNQVKQNLDIPMGFTGTTVTVDGVVQTNWEANTKANVNADNLTEDNLTAWKNALQIPESLILYNTTGQNTDGAMTQKAVTDELNNKVQKTNSKNNYVGTIDNLESSGSVQISCNYNNQYETILEIGSTYISSTSPIYEGNVTDENKLLKMSELPTVDAELSSTSENAVQNKVITTALNSKANTQDVPTALSELTEDTTHRTVTDTEKQTWNSKVEQEDLDSLKTSINTKVSIGKSSGANTSYINNNGSSIELIIGSGVETLSKIVIDSSGNVTIGGNNKITFNGLTADVNPQTDFKTMPTVSSSPIVDSDSNAKGYYVRFANGTQICAGKLYSSLRKGKTITFPQPFKQDSTRENIYVLTQMERDSGFGATYMNGQAINTISATGFVVYAGYSETVYTNWLAIGKWK